MILPLARPLTGNDGKELSELFVPKGTGLTISIIGANRESKVWGADTAEWIPERYVASWIRLISPL